MTEYFFPLFVTFEGMIICVRDFELTPLIVTDIPSSLVVYLKLPSEKFNEIPDKSVMLSFEQDGQIAVSAINNERKMELFR